MRNVSRGIGSGLLLACLWLGPGAGMASGPAAGAAAPPGTLHPAAAMPGPDGIIDMQVVAVRGVQPGPGLWRVRGPDGHTLHLLGTQSPLPRGIQWRAEEVRQVLGEAGMVLGSQGVSVDADVGFFRGLTLLPSAMKAMKNPDGKTLGEVLPADLHARWDTLRRHYMPRDRGVEKKRPVIAAYQLYLAALERNGLKEGGVVTPVMDSVLKPRRLKPTPAHLKLKIDDPRQALADFRREGLVAGELECVRTTLDIIERDLPLITARANAWASGDLAALRSMPTRRQQVDACMDAWSGTETARKLGFTGVEARSRHAWLEVAERALREQPVSFAMMPIENLLDEGGFPLADLRARGYEVLAPDAVEEAGATGLPMDAVAPESTRAGGTAPTP